MSSSFFRPFYYFFFFLIFLILFISCFFGPDILENSTFDDTYYSFDLSKEYIWPTPRLYLYYFPFWLS